VKKKEMSREESPLFARKLVEMVEEPYKNDEAMIRILPLFITNKLAENNSQ
jgi:hypothetical protein